MKLHSLILSTSNSHIPGRKISRHFKGGVCKIHSFDTSKKLHGTGKIYLLPGKPENYISYWSSPFLRRHVRFRRCRFTMHLDVMKTQSSHQGIPPGIWWVGNLKNLDVMEVNCLVVEPNPLKHMIVKLNIFPQIEVNIWNKNATTTWREVHNMNLDVIYIQSSGSSIWNQGCWIDDKGYLIHHP